MIHFECPACFAPFDVDDRLAGRTGKCKRCGSRMRVPAQTAAEAPVGVGSNGPRLTALAPVGPGRPQASLAAGRPINWLEAVNSQVALAPISMDNLRGLRSKPSPLDEPSIPGPYKLATAPSLPALKYAGGKPAGSVTRGYRGAMGHVQKLFRWLNESAYLVSVPFLMLLLLGLIIDNSSLMGLGATGAVLLNIGRIAAGMANLAVIPFRESPIQGILFLIPPFTFFYMAQNWHRMRGPVKRIIGPVLTIAFVAAAFLVEPALRSARKSEGSLEDRVKAGVGTLKKEVRQQIAKVPDLKAGDLESVRNKAEGALKSLKTEDAIKSIEGGLRDAAKAIDRQAP